MLLATGGPITLASDTIGGVLRLSVQGRLTLRTAYSGARG